MTNSPDNAQPAPRPVTTAEHDVLMAAARDGMTLVSKGRLVATPTAQAAPAADHDTLRCAVGNCTFNGEVDRHANGCPSAPQAAPTAGAVAGPSVFGLQWPDDKRINLSTIFDTEYEANKFILERCSTPGIRVVRLSEHPTPAAQADSVQGLQPVHDAVTIELLNERVAYLEGKLKEADSVLEDAARLDWLQHNGATVEIMQGRPNFDWCFRIAGLHATTRNSIREAIDAARKQGGTHD